MKKTLTRGNVLACSNPKNRYIQHHLERSGAVAADRKSHGLHVNAYLHNFEKTPEKRYCGPV